MASKTNIMVARVSGAVSVDGVVFRLHRGKTTAHNSHPIVRGREQMWRSLSVDYAVEEEVVEAPVVEEAVKAPKPKRGRPAKKAEAVEQTEVKADAGE